LLWFDDYFDAAARCSFILIALQAYLYSKVLRLEHSLSVRMMSSPPMAFFPMVLGEVGYLNADPSQAYFMVLAS
jgi:hypothetical protein